ncbi:MAG: MFS transporter [Dysgonamonadaceae bacterium]|jgi:DHA3 family macrolide efflux protein-like MFS transporter|nr:MFS transporter [Dysgonamonadaceae bacterium]
MNNWKKVFLIIWAGQAVSIFSSAVVGFALILWLSFETQSAETLALASVAAFLPQALIAPFAGVYIDRWDRKKVMIAADVFIAAVTFAMAVLFFFGEATVWFIYVLLALRSIGSAFHAPAMSASVPLLAPETELTRIAGVNQMIQSVCNLAAPATAALLIAGMNIEIILLLDVFGALVACVSLLFVAIPSPESTMEERQNVWKDMKSGLNEILSCRGIAQLMAFSVLASVCIFPIAALFPLMTLNYFGGTAFQIGLVEVFWGAGMLLGGAWLGINRYPLNKVILINLMYVALGLEFVFSGCLSAEGYAFFAVLTGLGGIAASIYGASLTALIQENIAPEKLGRVFSIFMSASIFPSTAGLLGAGFMADGIGLSATFVLLGCAVCLLGVLSFCTPSIMKLGKRR